MIVCLVCFSLGYGPVYMEYKDERVRIEFEASPRVLQSVGCDFMRMSNMLGIAPVMTRVREHVNGSTGVHEAGRAVDFREQLMNFHTHTTFQILTLINFINARWKRNDLLPTAIYHRLDETSPYHFHMQLPVGVMAIQGG